MWNKSRVGILFMSLEVVVFVEQEQTGIFKQRTALDLKADSYFYLYLESSASKKNMQPEKVANGHHPTNNKKNVPAQASGMRCSCKGLCRSK